MPKSKKHKSTSHRKTHHKKMGAIKEGSPEYYLLLGVGAIGGGIAAAFLSSNLQTAFGAQTPLSVGPGIVAAGGLGVALIGKGNPIALGVGAGMAAVGGTMLANETFLNVPGISGAPAFSSNASPASTVVRQAVGRANFMQKKLGEGPNGYVNQTVGATHMTRGMRRIGTLASN